MLIEVTAEHEAIQTGLENAYRSQHGYGTLISAVRLALREKLREPIQLEAGFVYLEYYCLGCISVSNKLIELDYETMIKRIKEIKDAA